MVVGEVPFQGETDYEVMAKQIMASLDTQKVKNRRIPPEVHFFIAKMTAKERESRYARLEDVVRDVAGYLPEGVLPMTQCAVYLATAPKSNTALTTYAAARKVVRDHGALPVPARLRNASTDLQKQQGHGDGYKYPHDFEGNYVPGDYLPDDLVGSRVYQPSRSGHEATIADRLAAWAERRKRGQ